METEEQDEVIPVKCEIIEISDEEVNTGPTKKKRIRKPNRKDPSKAVQCETCARMFGDKHQLKKHRMVHTDERPFVCASCGKSYRHKHVLKQHEMTHYGPSEMVKNFTCTECGSSFTRLSSLRTHQKIHTGVKPFACNLCDKAFTQKTNLLQHIMAHQDHRPHECDECHKKFITRSKLKQHYQKHVKKKLKERLQLVAGPGTAAELGSDTSAASASPPWAADSDDD